MTLCFNSEMWFIGGSLIVHLTYPYWPPCAKTRVEKSVHDDCSETTERYWSVILHLPHEAEHVDLVTQHMLD